MAPSVPTTPVTGTKIPSAEDVTTTGGVWAPTSAKRDRLKNFQAALVEEGLSSLDEMATKEDKLDLDLSHGMSILAKAVDEGVQPMESSSLEIQGFQTWLEQTSSDLPEDLTADRWESVLSSVSQKVDLILQGMPKTKYLQLMRDFIEEPTEEELEVLPEKFETDQWAEDTTHAINACLARHRLQLVQIVAEQLRDSWDKLTKLSTGDLDRSAVRGESAEPQVSSLKRDLLIQALLSFLEGTCSSRLDSVWNLMDRDQDGRVDEEEVTEICRLVVSPTAHSLQRLLEDSMEASPVLHPLPKLEGTEDDKDDDDDDDDDDGPPTGWMARRKERRAKARLRRMFRGVVDNHFEDEVEMPHRLRCIYAWAEKADQDNRIDSVQIDTGIGGRKRYVELNPKISLEEFREVQQIHFTHLDRVGQELLKSFHEELWIDQGRKRERKETVRQSAAFLIGVSLVDVGISML